MARRSIPSSSQAGQSEVLPGGFFVDAPTGRVFLRLPDRSDPNGQLIHLPTRNGAFLVDTQHDVIIEGFEMRFYGAAEYSGFGVDIRASDRMARARMPAGEWTREMPLHRMRCLAPAVARLAARPADWSRSCWGSCGPVATEDEWA